MHIYVTGQGKNFQLIDINTLITIPVSCIVYKYLHINSFAHSYKDTKGNKKKPLSTKHAMFLLEQQKCDDIISNGIITPMQVGDHRQLGNQVPLEWIDRQPLAQTNMHAETLCVVTNQGFASNDDFRPPPLSFPEGPCFNCRGPH